MPPNDQLERLIKVTNPVYATNVEPKHSKNSTDAVNATKRSPQRPMKNKTTKNVKGRCKSQYVSSSTLTSKQTLKVQKKDYNIFIVRRKLLLQNTKRNVGACSIYPGASTVVS